jgi:hypothetical protein
MLWEEARQSLTTANKPEHMGLKAGEIASTSEAHTKTHLRCFRNPNLQVDIHITFFKNVASSISTINLKLLHVARIASACVNTVLATIMGRSGR